MVKLFRIAVVLLVAVVSVVLLAVLLIGLSSVWPFAHTDGIVAVPGGVSEKLLRALLLLLVLCYLVWSRLRRRSR